MIRTFMAETSLDTPSDEDDTRVFIINRSGISSEAHVPQTPKGIMRGVSHSARDFMYLRPPRFYEPILRKIFHNKNVQGIPEENIELSQQCPTSDDLTKPKE